MSKNPAILLLTLLILLTLSGCCAEQPAPDLDALRAEVLAFHQASLQAHRDGNVDFFRDSIIEPGFLGVSRGEIRPQARADVEQMYSNYLGSTRFDQYEDLREPIIEVADDGSAAWIIAQVKVVGARTAEDGGEQPVEFVGAYLTLLKRQPDGGWLRRVNVVNFKQ